MLRWDREVPRPITWQEAQVHVKCPIWQAYRKSMKGVSTPTKLDMLQMWVTMELEIHGDVSRKTEVQVGNYINSLKRGGLLNLALEVIK